MQVPPLRRAAWGRPDSGRDDERFGGSDYFQTGSRWEKGDQQLGPQSDRLIRSGRGPGPGHERKAGTDDPQLPRNQEDQQVRPAGPVPGNEGDSV